MTRTETWSIAVVSLVVLAVAVGIIVVNSSGFEWLHVYKVGSASSPDGSWGIIVWKQCGQVTRVWVDVHDENLVVVAKKRLFDTEDCHDPDREYSDIVCTNDEARMGSAELKSLFGKEMVLRGI